MSQLMHLISLTYAATPLLFTLFCTMLSTFAITLFRYEDSSIYKYLFNLPLIFLTVIGISISSKLYLLSTATRGIYVWDVSKLGWHWDLWLELSYYLPLYSFLGIWFLLSWKIAPFIDAFIEGWVKVFSSRVSYYQGTSQSQESLEASTERLEVRSLSDELEYPEIEDHHFRETYN